MKEKILYIWRFQPFHNWHLSIIENILQNTNKKLIIWIWSTNIEYFTEKNPFSFIERKEMIIKSLKDKNIEVEWIPDFEDNENWRKYIEEKIHPDRVISWNDLVKSIFSDKILEIKKRYQNISATMIRNLIQQKQDVWKFISNSSLNYIYENGLYDRILDIKNGLKIANPEYELWEMKKELFLNQFKQKQLEFYAQNPLLAVDAVIIQNWKVLLIERKNPPYGWALPGGFVDKWEDLQTAVLRELKEELNLDGKIEKQIWIYDNPTRDPRWHTISVAFKIKAGWNPKADDDAKSYKWANIQDIKDWKVKLAFDHRKIILDALK